MKYIRNIGVNVLALIAVIYLSNIFSKTFLRLYRILTSQSGTEGWFDFSSLVGFFIAYAFILSICFTVFGGKYKYWILGVFYFPLLIYFVPSGDWAFLLVFVVLFVLGWLLGSGILKVYHLIRKT